MPKRIDESKAIIDQKLDEAAEHLQNEWGVGTAEFTRLVLEVIEARSMHHILTRSKTQIIFTQNLEQ